MCPPGYHHNGIMAARELGHQMYGYINVIAFNLYIYYRKEKTNKPRDYIIFIPTSLFRDELPPQGIY